MFCKEEETAKKVFLFDDEVQEIKHRIERSIPKRIRGELPLQEVMSGLTILNALPEIILGQD